MKKSFTGYHYHRAVKSTNKLRIHDDEMQYLLVL